MSLKNIEHVNKDGREFFGKSGIFDRIISGAAFLKIPSSLLKSLKQNRRLIAPTKNFDIRLIIKEEQGFKEKIFPGFSFVPFV